MSVSLSVGRPEFATNKIGDLPQRVADAISQMIAYSSDGRVEPTSVDIATAYFNVGGFSLLADALEAAGPVRLLLGAEPADFEVRSTITPLSVRGARRGNPRLQQALEEHAHALAEDRNLVGVTREGDAAVERLLAWLDSHDVQVRRLEKAFLHGKAFIIKDGGPGVMVGSSNMTYAGLARNRELNLGVYQTTTVERTQGWFEEQWEEAVPYDLASLYAARTELHQPWTVFLRMLYELYGDTFEEDTEFDNELGLTEFQADGVHRAKRILAKRGGVIVADEVGLGKTFVAGELIREAVIENRQKVLVVGPATLRDSTWKPFLKEKNINADVVSYEELVGDIQNDRVGKVGAHVQALDSYALVVVDEAHNLRNPSTQRADAFRLLLSGVVAKKLVLLTATPVNNSLADLQNLVSYIDPSDGAFTDIGIPSVRKYIGKAMAMDPEELSGKHLFELLDAISVKRTRRFIKTQYPHEKINGVQMVFPQAKVHRVDYHLEAVLPGFFDRLARALGAHTDDEDLDATGVTLQEPGTVLTMARYVPSRFLLGHEEVEQFEVQNAGLLRSALLKRFESSAAAFEATVRKMIGSHDYFLSALSQGKVLTGDALRAWAASDSDDIDDIVSSLDPDTSANNVDAASLYNIPALQGAIEADRALLEQMAQEVASVDWTDDPKIAQLADEIGRIAEEARQDGIGLENTRNRRKVLLFTYFTDTARYIEEALTALAEKGDPRLADYHERIVLATGGDRHGRQDAIVGFAPKTAGTADDEDKYDLAIATDVLSEGVNLQQAGHIINYDLPWNPMRLVQRHGRVDRIGSTHKAIHLRCFFPDDQLEELLQLEGRLKLKLHHASVAFGVGEGVLPGIEATERVIAETREEIQRLRDEEADIFNERTAAAASSEEFQRRLANAFKSAQTKKKVLDLPWGAGSVMDRPGTQEGFVFCAKIADHPRPEFRYVPIEDGKVRTVDGKPEVIGELLTSLEQADPRDPNTPAGDPSADLREKLYTTWEIAQADIYEDWTRRTDPAEFEPQVPKAMRDAAALVRKHGAVLGDEQDRLVERLNQVANPRAEKEIRGILAVQQNGNAQLAVRALQEKAKQLRLKVPKPVDPLPPVELNDIRLLTWVAIQN
ncbi:helicase-related protein [Kocuria oceani]|uniref:Helicase-related protein n=1 Tax=Kocuria oceani TaxID=988827 RepID=A0ABV9TJD3_9MICC|nr:helicase-related protein [Kocuria oceani]